MQRQEEENAPQCLALESASAQVTAYEMLCRYYAAIVLSLPTCCACLLSLLATSTTRAVTDKPIPSARIASIGTTSSISAGGFEVFNLMSLSDRKFFRSFRIIPARLIFCMLKEEMYLMHQLLTS